jgi:drug/metabolite transporter (DMT)-like permease
MVAAFAAVYVVWGSTYLAIKVVVEVLPPLMMAGVRTLVAGVILYAWALRSGIPAPTRAEWLAAAGAGTLWFVGGHGALFWGSQYIASGLAAVLFSTIPIWVAVFDSVSGSRRAPAPVTALGLAAGLAGIAWLNLPALRSGMVPWASLVVLSGAASWGLGMVWYRGARRPESKVLTSALPLVTGGAALLALSALGGEFGRISVQAINATLIMGLGYLIVFGSIITFSAYTWLLGVTSPTNVASYAYVNPVVALLLGWLLAGEQLTGDLMPPVATILFAVTLIVVGERVRERSARSIATA